MSPHLSDSEIWKFLLLVSEIAENFASGTRSPGLWNPESHFRLDPKSISTDRDWNPVPGIRNPCRCIQNRKLSWIPYSRRQRLSMRGFRFRSRLRSAPMHPVARDSLTWRQICCTFEHLRIASRQGPVHTYTDIFESVSFSFRIQKFPRAQVSGFTLVPRAPLGILATEQCVEVPRFDTLIK